MEEQLILNRYRPITEAGSGGFASVQLAWDTRIQRRVAIKCIHLKEEELQLGVYAGLDEARTAALLNDGTIVGVIDFEVQGATAYLIMEYVDGLTLTQLMQQAPEGLSLDVIAAVFSSVSRALEIAHDNQVLHLDIKPDNILVNRQGQVKVTDFGLAKLSDAAGFGSASGGTIGYMPPEQMRLESLDARCDEWALASVTYEMLTGSNPFVAPDLQSAEAAIENAEIVLPSLSKEGLPAEADDVIFYALDPDREQRYDNVTDFSEEMEQYLGNPVKGQRELAVLVGQATEDFEEEEEFVERISFFDRIGDRGYLIMGRVWAFITVFLLGFVALNNIPLVGGVSSPILWGLMALYVVGAFFKPHLGALLALLTLVVALFAQDALLVGIVMAVATPLWWFFVGRKGDAQTNTALATVFFGAFSFNQMTPLVTGFFLTARETLINTAMALLISIVLAGFGSTSLLGWNVLTFWDSSSMDVQGSIVHLLSQAGTWLVMASWLLSALTVRVFCLRQTRLFAFFGVLLGTIILLAGMMMGVAVGADWIGGVSAGYDFASIATNWLPVAATIAAGVVMSVLCTFGVPLRLDDWDEEEAE